MVAQGKSFPEIGRKLYMSAGGVKKACNRMRDRWGARNTAQLVHMAWLRGCFNYLAVLPREDSNLQQTP